MRCIKSISTKVFLTLSEFVERRQLPFVSEMKLHKKKRQRRINRRLTVLYFRKVFSLLKLMTGFYEI